MRHALWPEGSVEEHARELETPVDVAFVAEADDGTLIGFAEVSLHSRADGCDPSRPVGFLEGWYVAEPFRRTGVGAALVRATEDWARAQGCTEFASDTWLDNEVSQRAHEALGFEEVDRCVHYRKTL
ncbi:MAG TPA: GNAT family N-acetyltransferase [Thermoanaerobaculia bacterium]|nr:GNAT family N-acetyltransferase [Thermoanaerobaculia bacterium]